MSGVGRCCACDTLLGSFDHGISTLQMPHLRGGTGLPVCFILQLKSRASSRWLFEGMVSLYAARD